MWSAGRSVRSGVPGGRGRRCQQSVPLWMLAASLTLGCSGLVQVFGVDEQVEIAQRGARIDGRVDTEGPSEGTLVVALASPGASEGDPLVGVDT